MYKNIMNIKLISRKIFVGIVDIATIEIGLEESSLK